MNTKQVIVIRKDLNMRKGKMCSMAAHASMKVFFDLMEETEVCEEEGEYPGYVFKTTPAMAEWINGIFTKITCSCDSLEELEELYNKAKELNLPCSIITDAGLTEFNGVPTVTAIAIGPDEVDTIDQITKHLNLL